MVNDLKTLKKTIWLYGLIVCFANICSSLISNFFWQFQYLNNDVLEWNAFIEKISNIYYSLSILTIVVPIACCMMYVRSKKNFERYFINIPIAYAGMGTFGWFVHLIQESIYIAIALHQGYRFSVSSVLLPNVMNAIMESIVSFTFAFFIIQTIHRKYTLPRFFPEGHLNKIQGLKQPSIRLLFIIMYISVTLFPVVYLNITCKPNDLKTYVGLISIMIIGLIITIAFSAYIGKPITNLKKQIEKIKEGDYNSHVKIVTNDSFGDLADTMNDMVDSIREKNQRIQENLNLTITRMAIMVESRDNSTGGHIKRTSDCVRIFVNGLKKNPVYAGISDSFYASVIKAAPMHDLGKIAVKDSILTKNGKFTDEEYEQMKNHSAEGARIVAAILEKEEDIEFKNIAVNVAHYHHEKWDGSGYPERISGDAIPLEARIMALADVFDALVSKRCYKDSFSYEKSFSIIEESLGKHFDPLLGAEFLKCRTELEDLYNSYE